MSNKLITCLWFDHGKAREAAEFYARSSPTARSDLRMHAARDYPGGKKGDELTVEFTVLGQPFVGLNGGPNFKPNEAVSFMVLTEDQEETDRYWNAIVGNGGEESACGWCKDRWGFSWQITPRVLLERRPNPDKARPKRAMEAMMTMRKIDIATIEAAAAAASRSMRKITGAVFQSLDGVMQAPGGPDEDPSSSFRLRRLGRSPSGTRTWARSRRLSTQTTTCSRQADLRHFLRLLAVATRTIRSAPNSSASTSTC